MAPLHTCSCELVRLFKRQAMRTSFIVVGAAGNAPEVCSREVGFSTPPSVPPFDAVGGHVLLMTTAGRVRAGLPSALFVGPCERRPHPTALVSRPFLKKSLDEWKGSQLPPTARQEKHGMVHIAPLSLTKRRARAQDVSLRHHPQLRR